MMKSRIHLVYCWLSLFSIYMGLPHPASGQFSDCQTGIFVCQSSYTQLTAPPDSGLIQELDYPSNTSCLATNENYTAWYIFTVSSGGTLEFVINPMFALDDYDFALFNITGLTCNDIANGTAPEVRCNYSAAIGPTGLAAGYSGVSEPSGGLSFCAPLTVNAGETYALVVDYFSGNTGSFQGYDLNFSGTATIFDNIAPRIDSVLPVNCNRTNQITVQLSEPVLCSSIAPDGSDFAISGPSAVTIASASGNGCSTGNTFTSQVVLNFTAPISVTGTYYLKTRTGTDGNTLEDNCGNAALDGVDSIPFLIPDVVIASFTHQTVPQCHHDSVYFTSTSTGQITNYLWSFGDGTIDTARNPVHAYHRKGTYVVTLTVSNPYCSNTTRDTITLVPVYKANFTWSPSYICQGIVVSFRDSTIGTPVSWEWDFDDGTSSIQPNPFHAFNNPGTYDVRLITTDNTGCRDTVIKQVTVVSNITATFDMSTRQGCTGDPIQFADLTAGNPVQWHWMFGDGSTSSQPNPTHQYSRPGTYLITLQVTDSLCGMDTEQDTLVIFSQPFVYLGSDTAICDGEVIVLNAAFGDASYLWSTGEVTPSITIREAPVEVWVVVDNYGCIGSDTIRIMQAVETCPKVFIPSAFSPNGDGHNDFFHFFIPNLVELEVFIYNRWGELIYYSDDLAQLTNRRRCWNGKYRDEPQDIGTYQYVIKGRYANGEPVVFSGNLTLIR